MSPRTGGRAPAAQDAGRRVVLAVLAIAMAACAPAAPSATASPPASPPPSVAAEPTRAGSAFGPLAIVPPSDGTDLARNEGVIHLGAPCATLSGRGRITLLLWPLDRTTWNAADHTVSFHRIPGPTVTITDGQRVAVGGSGDLISETGLAPEAWLDARPWIARPPDGCRFDAYWFVGDIEAEP